MQLHTFKAKEMREALALVRRELGPDAIIVETRKIPGRGIFSSPMIEIRAQRDRSSRASRTNDPKAGTFEDAAHLEDSGAKIKPTIPRGNHHKMRMALSRASRLKQSTQSGSLPVTIAQNPDEARKVATASRSCARTPHAALRRRLLGAMLPRDICETLLGQLASPSHHSADGEQQLRTILSSQLGDPHSLLCSGSRVAALVGPTGVGKTTTIAKLAAYATIYENKSVTLLCLDDQRVGAVAQLQEYGALLQIPVERCASHQQIARLLAKHRNRDLILVDTPGVSLADDSAMQRLGKRLRRAGERVSTHLCVASSTRQEELDRIMRLYGRLEPDALIATKMDEAVAIGSVVAARLETATPFSYFTNGQKVPEDISFATSELICDTLLGDDSGSDSSSDH